MCNIAGYSGNRQAAPILIEMLRRQQSYDGALSTGVATIHEGKLHYRKVVGDVDALLRETDALSLPGTIGIAHSRPAADKNLPHPYISMDGRMALVTNGNTPPNHYSYLTDNTLELLEKEGFKFTTEMEGKKEGFPSLSNGNAVSPAEGRVHLVDYYLKKGLCMEEAMARCSDEMYADNVFLTLSLDAPDRISALRTTRPMNILLGDGETFLATTTFGFPDDVEGEIMALPLMHVCSVTNEGFTVTKHRIRTERVAEVNPRAYALAYNGLTEFLLTRKDNPVYLDEIVHHLDKNIKGIWNTEHTYNQRVRLTYNILEQLDKEGRLRFILRKNERNGVTRDLRYMWAE